MIEPEQKFYAKEAQEMQKFERPSQEERSDAKWTKKKDFKTHKAEFIFFFRKKTCHNEEEQRKPFTETVANFRVKLPTARNGMTILKTTVEEKMYRICIRFARAKTQSSILELKLNGRDVRGKHTKAWGPRDHPLNSFSREVTVCFRSFPHFFGEEDIYDCIIFHFS